MIISQNGAVDLIPEYNRALRPIFCVSEGDANSRTINLTVTSAGEVFTIPEGAEVYVAGKKQDNTIFTYQCAYSGYIVSFPVAEQMSAANGLVLCELQIVVAGDPLGSANFCYWVEPSPIANGSSSESDLNIFEQAIAALGGYEYLTSEVSVLSARMDEFTKLPDGSLSTSADAELADVRVMANGATAATAGDAVREQVTEIKNELTADVDFSNNGDESVRMLSPFERGAVYDGAIQTYGKYRVANTNLITFTEATRIKIKTGFWIIIAFFVNGTYSSTTSWTATLYDIPANSTVRFSIRRETEDTSEIANIVEFTNAVTFVSPIGKNVATNTSDISSLKTRMTTAETNISAVATAVVTKGAINSSNYSTLGFDSVTDLPANSIWGIGSDLTATMITDLPVYGKYGQIKKTSGLLPNDIYIKYEYTSADREMYIAWQNNATAQLSTWTKVATGEGNFSQVLGRTLITSSSKVIFIGDSIVAGVGGTGWQQSSGRFLLTYNNVDLYANDNGTCWANMLRDYLETNYGCTAYNNGLSGFNSVNIPENIATLVPSDATHVITCWGINDRAYNYDTVAGYQTVIDYCNSIGAKIIPLTICPCLQPNDTYSHTQYEILTRVKKVCADNNLEVCDMFSAVKNYFYTKGITLDTNYIPDNLHPNDAMYTIMYNIIRGLLGV